MNAPATNDRMLTGLTLICCAVFVGLAGRLVYIQGFRPDSARYTLGANPARVSYIPAPRGELLDRRGERLVFSQHTYNLRGNPVVISNQAPQVAAMLSPLLSIPAAVLEERLTIRPELRWKAIPTTNASGLVTTQWANVLHTNQNVLVASNLTHAEWTRVQTNLKAFRSPEQERLLAASAALARRRTNATTIAWWDLPAKYRFRKEIAREGKEITQALKKIQPQLREIRENGITREIVERRVMPHGQLAAPVLGSTTNGQIPMVEYRTATQRVQVRTRELPADVRGADGIERQFDDELHGVPGQSVLRRGKGRELAGTRELDLPPQPGANVRLTLDANLQYVAENALQKSMGRLRPNWMSAILVRPSTGEILALANATDPRYVPAQRPGTPPPTNGPAKPRHRNHAVSELVEPGSTFKLVTYAAAFEALPGRSLTPESRIDCEGGLWHPPAGRRKPIADARGHKLHTATLEEAFAASSNVGAAKLGYALWDPAAPPRGTALVRYADTFGLLRRTGILCGGEPNPRIPAWDGLGTQLILSYGYGIYTTPLQIAMAYAAVANDGILMEPMLVKSVETPSGGIIRNLAPRQVGRVVSPETARHLVRLMTAVVGPKGTGKDATMDDYTVAGKTGTANKMTKEHMESGITAHFSTFVGFLPAENPQICLLVCADEPKGSDGRAAYGAACVPVFKEIVRETASYLTIPPSPTATVNTLAAGSGGHPTRP
jgi:cell division protein FtsI (penicillin-binding protein 3)